MFLKKITKIVEGFEANIILKEKVISVFKKAYRIPYKVLEEVDRKIDELVEKDLWIPVQ